jgi:hypothetical protein
MRGYGLVLALEPLCAAECNFINTLAEGAEIVRRVSAPNFGCWPTHTTCTARASRPKR